MAINSYCPCGSKNIFIECCGAYINDGKIASTPEALMRSRYTAYATRQIDYIEKTMREKAAQQFDKKAAFEWATQAVWIGLTVVSSRTENDWGWVEFIARYRINDKNHAIHELSEFKKIDGLWYYVDGKMFNGTR